MSHGQQSKPGTVCNKCGKPGTGGVLNSHGRCVTCSLELRRAACAAAGRAGVGDSKCRTAKKCKKAGSAGTSYSKWMPWRTQLGQQLDTTAETKAKADAAWLLLALPGFSWLLLGPAGFTAGIFRDSFGPSGQKKKRNECFCLA